MVNKYYDFFKLTFLFDFFKFKQKGWEWKRFKQDSDVIYDIYLERLH